MTSDQALALFISFILLACLTLQSVVLGHDMLEPSDEKGDRGVAIRLISLLILWAMWALFTINFIPWGSSEKEAVKDAVAVVEDATTTDSAQSAVGL